DKDNHSTTSSTVSCLSGESTPDLSLGGDSEAESQDGLDKTIEIFLEDECEFKFYEDSVSNDDDEAAKAQWSAAEKDNSGSLSPD
ncbi:MAG: hypothetical protein ACTHJ4_02870, partial [Candidatus Nucleicultricaceae bacterium]